MVFESTLLVVGLFVVGFPVEFPVGDGDSLAAAQPAVRLIPVMTRPAASTVSGRVRRELLISRDSTHRRKPTEHSLRAWNLGRFMDVRLTQFRELVDGQFGTVRGASVVVDHVLTQLGGRTATQAIEEGVDPRDVWWALCADFDVPRDQW